MSSNRAELDDSQPGSTEAHQTLRVARVQAAPARYGRDGYPESSEDDIQEFVSHTKAVVDECHPDMVVFPELHLFGCDDEDLEVQNQRLRDAARPASELIDVLGAAAAEIGTWLIPGSVCERGDNGELFNTAFVFDPHGQVVASYRKMFPWRPTEPYSPGAEPCTFEIPGWGRLGLNICYDNWWPELSRHFGWLGVDAVINIVKTTTPDREQELVVARANSITNQFYTLSVNAAAPIGMGRSIIVDPQGHVLDQADAEPTLLVADVDRAEVQRAWTEGVEGSVFPWNHFLDGDEPISLPLYSGAIQPTTWHHGAGRPTSSKHGGH